MRLLKSKPTSPNMTNQPTSKRQHTKLQYVHEFSILRYRTEMTQIRCITPECALTYKSWRLAWPGLIAVSCFYSDISTSLFSKSSRSALFVCNIKQFAVVYAPLPRSWKLQITHKKGSKCRGLETWPRPSLDS